MYKKAPPLEKTYNKTLLAIESCQTIDQLESAGRMVKNFKSLYKEVGCPKALYYNLNRKLDKQYTICQL